MDQTDPAASAERDLEALLELSESLVDTADIEGTLFRISGMMAGALASDRCSVLLLEESGASGVIIASSDDPSVSRLRIELDKYPEVREVVRSGEPLIVPDVEAHQLFDEVRDTIRDKPLGSAILFPVSVDREVQAVLHLRTRDKRTVALIDREVRFGRIVANATGIALRNARVFDVLRNRSERIRGKHMEVERRLEQIEKYQRFFDFAGDGLMIIDGNATILFANRAARALLGFDEAALRAVTLHDLVEDDARETLHDLMQDVMHGRYQRALELPVIRASGEVAVLSLTTAGLEDEPGGLPRIVDGRPVRRAARDATAIVSFRDVTQTRRMQDELRRTKDFLVNVIESSADAIVAADMSGRILLFNQVAQDITGYTEEDALGINVADMYPPGGAHRIMTDLRAAEFGGSGKLEERRETLLTRDGREVPVNLAAAIVYDKGEERATVGIFSDLRERLRMEESLRSAEHKAAVVETAGAAAHELNQPLTSIIGSMELLLRKVPEESPARPYLDTVMRESERMAQIVGKLGHITRYQTKHYVGQTDILDLDAASDQTETEP